VIDNGFDTDVFRPDEAARASVREELGLEQDTPLVGLIARYHPIKGHEVFLRAAAGLAHALPAVHFLLVGRDVDGRNPELAELIESTRLAGRVHMLGEREDVPRLTAAGCIGMVSARK